ncbi:MAG: hypothetical protein AB1457_16160 [Chloroflexota bacterium]
MNDDTMEIKRKIAWIDDEIRRHTEIAAITKQIEEVMEEIRGVEVTLQAAKEEVADLAGQKAIYVGLTCGKLAEEATRLLPEGRVWIDINDGGDVGIGWINPSGERVPYSGLSGGQKVAFDLAFSAALLGQNKNKIVIVEAAEIDAQRFSKMLEHLSEAVPDDMQVIVNTCHKVTAPTGWKVIDLNGGGKNV